MINTNKKGFTLVELIVVITILTILGTIGFISLQGYSSASRDSKRITDLGQIRTGIQLYQAKNGILPEPSDSITVGSGSTIYTIQGYAGTGTLRDIKVNDDAKDPLEENYYTYTTNGSKTKFQLLTLLENNNTAYNNVIPKTYANYETRKPYVIGDKLGTLLEPTTNIPVQELGNNVDLTVDTNEYLPIFSRKDDTIYSGLLLAQEMEKTSGSVILESSNFDPLNLTLKETITLNSNYDGSRDANFSPWDIAWYEPTNEILYSLHGYGCNSSIYKSSNRGVGYTTHSIMANHCSGVGSVGSTVVAQHYSSNTSGQDASYGTIDSINSQFNTGGRFYGGTPIAGDISTDSIWRANTACGTYNWSCKNSISRFSNSGSGPLETIYLDGFSGGIDSFAMSDKYILVVKWSTSDGKIHIYNRDGTYNGEVYIGSPINFRGITYNHIDKEVYLLEKRNSGSVLYVLD